MSGIIWTKKRVIDALLDFNDQYGKPPSSIDWNPSLARHFGYHDRAERFYEDGVWPSTFTVNKRFGSWSKALKAAGLPPNLVGNPAHRGNQ